MIPVKTIISTGGVYGSAIADQATQHGLAAALTSTQISNMVFAGVTLGGWVTIVTMVGTLLIFVVSAYKFYDFFKKRKTANEGT